MSNKSTKGTYQHDGVSGGPEKSHSETFGLLIKSLATDIHDEVEFRMSPRFFRLVTVIILR